MSTEFYIYGAPDDFKIYCNGRKLGRCYFENDNAYPFIIYEDKLYLGRKGGDHVTVLEKFVGMDSISFQKRIDAAVEKGDYNELKKLNELWGTINISDGVNGRIFLSPNQNFKHTIISFWNDTAIEDLDRGGDIINQLLRNFNVSQDDVFVASFIDRNKGKLIPLPEWDYYIPEADETQKKARELHLMKAKDKHDATTSFRAVRDKTIYVPREKAVGSMAAYHHMVHAENINRIIKNVLKEYINKNARRIIR